MHQEQRQLPAQGNSLFRRLPRRLGQGHHDVAQRWRLFIRDGELVRRFTLTPALSHEVRRSIQSLPMPAVLSRERQHVGGLVQTAILPVQLPNRRVVGNQQAHLALRIGFQYLRQAGTNRGGHPFGTR